MKILGLATHRRWRIAGWLGICGLAMCAVPSMAQNDASTGSFSAERQRYEEEVGVALQPVQKRYANRLKALQKVLTKKGDKEAVAEVEAELERLGDTMSQKVNYPIEGKWKVEYKNGATRTYVIHADGRCEFIEGSTLGRFSKNGNDVLMDFGDNKLERFHWKTVLAVEHFNPKSTYGVSEPNLTGFAVKVK